MQSLGNAIRKIGEVAWRAFQAVNTPPAGQRRRPRGRGPPGRCSSPTSARGRRWATRGETDSLCPRCVVETRGQILRGERNVSDLVNGHLGEIKATLYEQDNQVRVRKTCPDARHLRGPDLDRRRVLARASRAASRAATSPPWATS